MPTTSFQWLTRGYCLQQLIHMGTPENIRNIRTLHAKVGFISESGGKIKLVECVDNVNLVTQDAMAMERRSEELKANGSRRIKPRRRCSVTRPAMEAMTQIRIAQHGNNKHSISTISTVCQEHAGHLESNTFIRIKFEIDDTSSRLLLSSNGREKVCGSHGFRDARVRTLLAGIAWQCCLAMWFHLQTLQALLPKTSL